MGLRVCKHDLSSSVALVSSRSWISSRPVCLDDSFTLLQLPATRCAPGDRELGILYRQLGHLILDPALPVTSWTHELIPVGLGSFIYRTVGVLWDKGFFLALALKKCGPGCMWGARVWNAGPCSCLQPSVSLWNDLIPVILTCSVEKNQCSCSTCFNGFDQFFKWLL